jgi:hypothetical protein
LHLDCSSGYIENTDIPIALCEEIVHEGRFASSNVDDRRGNIRDDGLDKLE